MRYSAYRYAERPLGREREAVLAQVVRAGRKALRERQRQRADRASQATRRLSGVVVGD